MERPGRWYIYRPMPYKDKAKRNARAKELRRTKGDVIRAYHREYAKNYRIEHLAELRAYQNEWRRAQRRKLRGAMFGKRRRMKTDRQIRQTKLANRKRWYAKHKNEHNLQRRTRRQTEPDVLRSLDRARYKRDREKRIHASRIQRAKRTGSACWLSLLDWKRLLREHQFRCFYCGEKLTRKTRSIDHRIPLKRGGTNDKENLVPSCRRCNSRKHSMTAEEFQQSRKSQ